MLAARLGPPASLARAAAALRRTPRPGAPIRPALPHPALPAASAPARRRLLSAMATSSAAGGPGPPNVPAAGPPSAREALEPGTLVWLATKADPSWVHHLTADPEAAKHAPNKTSREVTSGHYVPLKPTPLPKPRLVIVSEAMAAELGLSPAELATERFARFFAGDMAAAPGFEAHGAWATPYALSIMGQEMLSNCPYGTGNGYGDGRAISIAEVVVDGPPAGAAGGPAAPRRWELQLKGGGTTPWCRGGDGRAVLRSSIREFLASEAMWALGVPTTRALSLVVSGSETSQRRWYTGERPAALPTLDDPRLAPYPVAVREQLIAQVALGGETMLREPCAITTRVSPSFLRVGHMELFARRARAGRGPHSGPAPPGPARAALEALWRHALFREYPECADQSPQAPLQPQILALLATARGRIARLTANWQRVGFCQGNFNSDNCLVGGRTMDYGPFGFIERYRRNWCMWVGGGEHYAFRAQASAGGANFASLASAALPLLDAAGVAEAQDIVEGYEQVAAAAEADVWRQKLGLASWSPEAEALWGELDEQMETSVVDWTIFWRRLADARLALGDGGAGGAEGGEALLKPLLEAFYAPPCDARPWHALLGRWAALQRAEGRPAADVAAGMKEVSPKYVPREWMLVEAYQRAYRGDESELRALHELFKRPYEEQGREQEAAYFRVTPPQLAGIGGVAQMT